MYAVPVYNEEVTKITVSAWRRTLEELQDISVPKGDRIGINRSYWKCRWALWCHWSMRHWRKTVLSWYESYRLFPKMMDGAERKISGKMLRWYWERKWIEITESKIRSKWFQIIKEMDSNHFVSEDPLLWLSENVPPIYLSKALSLWITESVIFHSVSLSSSFSVDPIAMISSIKPFSGSWILSVNVFGSIFIAAVYQMTTNSFACNLI